MAMLAASRFTVGSALEEQAETEQAETGHDVRADHPVVPLIDHESAFEAGLALILDGLTHRVEGVTGGAGAAE
jgi:TetR/AcrR family tetracycline transcriptional repressor